MVNPGRPFVSSKLRQATALLVSTMLIAACDSAATEYGPRVERSIAGCGVSYVTLCSFRGPAFGDIDSSEAIEEQGVFMIDHETGLVSFEESERIWGELIDRDGTGYSLQFDGGNWSIARWRLDGSSDLLPGISRVRDVSLVGGVRSEAGGTVFVCLERSRRDGVSAEVLRRVDDLGHALDGELRFDPGMEIDGFVYYSISMQNDDVAWVCMRTPADVAGGWAWRTWKGSFSDSAWTGSVDGGFEVIDGAGTLLEVSASVPESRDWRLLVKPGDERAGLRVDVAPLFGSRFAWVWDEAEARPTTLRLDSQELATEAEMK